MNKSKTPEYHSWASMKYRCNNPKGKAFANYGGRGIKYCKRWNIFENFLEDMGKRPRKGYSIDRINNDKDYSKKNCRWATWSQQQNNRRNNYLFVVEGKKYKIRELARKYRIKYDWLYNRIYTLKWNIERAIHQKVKKREARIFKKDVPTWDMKKNTHKCCLSMVLCRHRVSCKNYKRNGWRR